MALIKYIILIIWGFGSGVVISGAVFAFIAIIGIVPRLAQKTNTKSYITLYEEAIIAGGIIGTILGGTHFYFPIGKIAVTFISLCIGIFFGCLAVSLAEILDVIPILSRRARIQEGMFFFILAIAVGKLFGSILYYLVPGFYYFGF